MAGSKPGRPGASKGKKGPTKGTGGKNKRSLEGRGPDQGRAGHANDAEPESTKLERTVAVVGTINTLATVGVLAVTSLLAMEGSESMRFAATARKLP